MIVFAFFCALGLLTFANREERGKSLARNRSEWLLDSSGLFMQGIAIPALQVFLSNRIFAAIFPGLQGVLDIPGWAAFLLNFVGVDYLYYWNHRILHHRRLWPIHAVHHSPAHLDWIVTSRNTVWTPFFIVYLWANGLFIHLLKDPTAFAIGASVGAGLDLWRHTRFSPRPGSRLERVLGSVLILPIDHAWHHSRDIYDVNFGANFKLWDQLHGTYHARPDGVTPALGSPIEISLARQAFWPFAGPSKRSAE